MFSRAHQSRCPTKEKCIRLSQPKNNPYSNNKTAVRLRQSKLISGNLGWKKKDSFKKEQKRATTTVQPRKNAYATNVLDRGSFMHKHMLTRFTWYKQMLIPLMNLYKVISCISIFS